MDEAKSMDKPILDKFTDHLKQSLKNGLKLALELKQEEVTPLHLLYGLVLEKGSVAGEILKKEKISKDRIVSLILNQPRLNQNILPKISKQSEKILEKAAAQAFKNGHRYIGTEHLLYALTESPEDSLINVLSGQKKSLYDIKEELENVLLSVNRFPEISSLVGNGSPLPISENMPPALMPGGQKNKNKKTPALDYFTTDLTNPKALKSMDPIIGRAKETQRLVQILSRRQKNNPVLLGDPGVGKTAIVEGLAQKIISGDVPDELQGKKLLRLDLGLLIAGTIYRGEFEGRLKQLMDEIKSDPNIIVFIDEMHTIVGAGSASGTLDAANILKPALARGEMRCIGATTFEEYKKHIESDPALDRRFQPIIVNEPTSEETIQILSGVAKNYAAFHGVEITPSAIEAAVKLAERFYPEKFFPDKAIDLLDEAAAAKKLSTANKNQLKKIKEIDNQIKLLQEAKREAVAKENFSLASRLKKQEADLNQDKNSLQNQSAKNKSKKKHLLEREDITNLLTQSFGFSLSSEAEEISRFKIMEEKLKSKIVGQDQVIQKILNVLKKTALGLRDPQRPIASFLFVGPSGVGKTELTKTLADAYFPEQQGRSNFIRIDMSEFGESFHATKLIGAPAGYVGYKESNSLADKIKNRPYSVILLDEIDKAHPDIFNIFLQILDEGYLTDATGKKINFKNTIIIMTANLGDDFFRLGNMGFGEQTSCSGASSVNDQDVKEELRKKFRADFLNRIDQILIFNDLTEKNLEEIITKQLLALGNKVADKINIQTSPQIISFLTDLATSSKQGARGINKIIAENIEEKLADFIYSQNNVTQSKPKIKLTVQKKQVKIIYG